MKLVRSVASGCSQQGRKANEMTLEYLEDGDHGLPLLLLHGGSISERAELYRIFQALAAGTTRVVRLHELPFVDNPDGLTFTSASADVDFGVAQGKSNATFQWKRSLESWSRIAMLMEPFVAKGTGGGVQYLNDAEGPEVIYSTRRAW
jgi:hypothetical protein